MDNVNILIKDAIQYLGLVPHQQQGAKSTSLIQALLAQVRFDAGHKEEARIQSDRLDRTLAVLEKFLSTKEGDKKDE